MEEEKVEISKDVVDSIKEILKSKGRTGGWDFDEYNLGLYNGMEFVVSAIEGRDPIFKHPPKEYLKDKSKKYFKPVLVKG